MRGDGDGAAWAEYLRNCHRHRASITERLLDPSIDDANMNPYQWVTGLIPAHGFVVDVACGSCPLWSAALSGRYLGIDLSAEELAVATDRGAHELRVGSAADLPIEDDSAAVVLCSMALQILPDLPRVLGEIRRVRRLGGLFAAIIPAGRVGVKDLPKVAGLVAALGRRLSYPNDVALKHAAELFDTAGLNLTGDEHRRFVFPLTSPANAAPQLNIAFVSPGIVSGLFCYPKHEGVD